MFIYVLKIVHLYLVVNIIWNKSYVKTIFIRSSSFLLIVLKRKWNSMWFGDTQTISSKLWCLLDSWINILEFFRCLFSIDGIRWSFNILESNKKRSNVSKFKSARFSSNTDLLNLITFTFTLEKAIIYF